MENFKVDKLCLFVLLIFVFLQPSLVDAEALSLEGAIQLGIENNHELKSLKAEIKDNKRKIELIKAQYFGWSLNLVGGFNKTGEEWRYEEEVEKTDEGGNLIDEDGEPLPPGEDPIIITKQREEENKNRDFNFGLLGDKSFTWGLELDYGFNLFKQKKKDDFELSEVFKSDNISYELEARQQLYPFIPAEGEQKLYRQKNELNVAKLSYEWQKEEKIMDWLESYLELLRLQQQLEIAEDSHQLAKKVLNRTVALKEIGEAGRRDLLEAKINLEETKINYHELSDEFDQQRKRWFQKLGVEEGAKLKLIADDSFLLNKENLVADLEFDFEWEKKLLSKFENHPELKSNRLNQSLLEKEREWSKLEDRSRPLVNLEGSYEYHHQKDVQVNRDDYHNWSIGFNLEYNLFDSGVSSLTQAGYEDDLDQLQREENNLIKELELNIKELLKELDRNYLVERKQNLSVKKFELEKEVAKERLKEGVITEEEFKESYFTFKSNQIKLKAAKDQILLTKLRLNQRIADNK